MARESRETGCDNDDDFPVRTDSSEEVPPHLWEYAVRFESLQRNANVVQRYLEDLLDHASVTPLSVTARAKALQSYRLKSERTRVSGSLAYEDPTSDITDCIAARVIVFSKADKSRVCEVIRQTLCPIEDQDPGQSRNNGYSSQLFLIGSDCGESRIASLEYFRVHRAFEVQVRTVSEHAWAEFEHHVRFKPIGQGAYNSVDSAKRSRVDLLLSQASGSRDAMDRAFEQIDEILRPDITTRADGMGVSDEAGLAEQGYGTHVGLPDLDQDSLRDYLSQRYPRSAPPPPESLPWMLDLLQNLNLTTASAVDDVLTDVDSDAIAGLIEHRYPPGQIRQFDDDLLASLGERYIAANEIVVSKEPNRGKILQWRWGRLQGKLKIYSLLGVDVPANLRGSDLTATAALRAVVETVSVLNGVGDCLIVDAVSLTRDLPGSARAKPFQVGGDELWIATNLSRRYAEDLSTVLLKKLNSGRDVALLRAGEQIWPERLAQNGR